MLLLLALLSTHGVYGQQGSATAGGYYHNGRYIGFVPKHRRIQSDGPHFAETRQSVDMRPNHASPEVKSEIRGVSYEEGSGEMISELPYEVTDSSDGPMYESVVSPGMPIGCGGSRWWGRAEYLHWATSRMDLPPLATSSAAGTAQDEAGVLGEATTTVLFGDEGLSNSGLAGGRFTIGKWSDDWQTQGWDITYVTLEEGTATFLADETTNAILARPFFNTDLNAEDARLIAFPGLVEGSLRIDTTVDFQTATVLFRRAAMRSETTHIDIQLGYRYADLEDAVRFQEDTTGLSGPANGAVIRLIDEFRAQNTFNGGQIGMRTLHRPNELWSLELLSSFAVGGTSADIDLTGQTTTTPAGGQATTTQNGLLVQGTNRGRVSRDDLGYITDFDLTFRRRLWCGPIATFGYSFVYWSDVYRASSQIDTQVNPTQIPPGTLEGNSRPAVPLITTDFWAQGLHGGLEFYF